MDILELLASRRTYRRFLQKPVPADVIADMAEAVRLSSCGANRQAIRLVVVQSPEMVAQVQPLVKWAAYLPPEQGTPQPEEQPVLKGVGSCIMGAIDRPRLTELLGLADNEKLHTMVAFGYPAHAARVVPLTGETGVKYYLDANRDYCVPKRDVKEIVRYL